MQAELSLLQQAVEIHGLVLAFHRSWGGLVRAAIWKWQGQKGQGRGSSILSASWGGKLRHSRALLAALPLHSQAGHSGDGDRNWAGHTPLTFTARGGKICWVQLDLEGLTQGHPMGAVLVAEPALCQQLNTFHLISQQPNILGVCF